MSARRIMIVGGGAAAFNAARGAREADAEAEIILLSDEDAAPYDRTTLSKEVLQSGILPRDKLLQSAEDYAAAGIRLRTGARVLRLDSAARMVETAESATETFDSLVLATGSRPRRLGEIESGVQIHYLRWEPDALALRRQLLQAHRIAVIGAGLIGLEVAAAASTLGIEVDVLEAAPGVLGRCTDPTTAAAVEQMHRSRGVRIHTGCDIAALEARGDGTRIATRSHGALDVDLVVAGIGIVPDTSLAEAAGLAVKDGIVVDACGRTSADGIYAAGDVARLPLAPASEPVRLENWRHAQEHGRCVGANAAGAERIFESVPSYWSEQYGHRLQGAGLIPRAAARTVVRDYGDGTRTSFLLDGDGRLEAAVGFDRGQDVAAARRLIAARLPVDPELLADRALPVARIVKQVVSRQEN